MTVHVLLFVAAVFAIIYVSFWTEEGTVARKPAPPVSADAPAMPPRGAEK